MKSQSQEQIISNINVNSEKTVSHPPNQLRKCSPRKVFNFCFCKATKRSFHVRERFDCNSGGSWIAVMIAVQVVPVLYKRKWQPRPKFRHNPNFKVVLQWNQGIRGLVPLGATV